MIEIDDDEGSLGFDDPAFGLEADASKPGLKSTWDDDIDDVLEETSSKSKKKKDKAKKTYNTSKEEMMSVFGFQQGSCDFCLKFVDDQSVGLLQKCLCNKKYFCTQCMKGNKLVAAHQQECAMERFQKLQRKRELAGK